MKFISRFLEGNMRLMIRTAALSMSAVMAFAVTGCFGHAKATPANLASVCEDLGAEECDYDSYIAKQSDPSSLYGDPSDAVKKLEDGYYCTVSGSDIEDILNKAEKNSMTELNMLIDSFNEVSDKEWNPGELTYDNYGSMEEMTSYSSISTGLSGISYCYVTSFEFDSKSAAESYYDFQTEHADDADELLDSQNWGFESKTKDGNNNGIDYFVYQMNMSSVPEVEMNSYALILRDKDCVTTFLIIDMAGKKGYRTANKILDKMGIISLDEIME